jgi:hypothetical protein
VAIELTEVKKADDGDLEQARRFAGLKKALAG